MSSADDRDSATQTAVPSVPVLHASTAVPLRASLVVGRTRTARIELVVVALVVLTIAAIVGLSVSLRHSAVREETASSELVSLKVAVKSYIEWYGRAPERLQDLVATPDALRLLDEVPVDPWGQPYELKRDGELLIIFSRGADGQSRSRDDLDVTILASGAPCVGDPPGSGCR